MLTEKKIWLDDSGKTILIKEGLDQNYIWLIKRPVEWEKIAFKK